MPVEGVDSANAASFLHVKTYALHANRSLNQGNNMSWSKRGASGKAMVAFTLLQVMWTGLVFGITWIPVSTAPPLSCLCILHRHCEHMPLLCCVWLQVAGIVFPVPILLLIPIRQYVLPRLFAANNLSALDPAIFDKTQQQPGDDCLEMRNQNTTHNNDLTDDDPTHPRV